jgi:hypothetical protein
LRHARIDTARRIERIRAITIGLHAWWQGPRRDRISGRSGWKRWQVFGGILDRVIYRAAKDIAQRTP